MRHAINKITLQFLSSFYCPCTLINLLFVSKLFSKYLVGGWLAWAKARGASEQRKLLAQEENALVSDEWIGSFFKSCW